MLYFTKFNSSLDKDGSGGIMSPKESHVSDAILDYIQKGMEQEDKRTEGLDSKSEFIISITSILIGASFAIVTLVFKDLVTQFHNIICIKLIIGIILVVADICFLVAIILALRTGASRKYKANLVFTSIDIDKWASGLAEEFKITQAKQIQQNWLCNRIENDLKVLMFQKATFWLGCGIIILSVGIIISLGYLLVWINI